VTDSTWLDSGVVSAVRQHMRDDHADATLAIARTQEPSAVAAVVDTLDAQVLVLTAALPDSSTRSLTFAWPVPLRERGDIRVQVVELYAMCAGSDEIHH